MSKKSAPRQSDRPIIAYYDALKLPIDGYHSVASASISRFRAWCIEHSRDLPGEVKHELSQLDFSLLVERWYAVLLLIEHGVSIDQSS